MKKILLLLLITLSQKSLSFDFIEPVYSPEKAVKLTIDYLSNVKKIERSTYIITSVSFNSYDKDGDYIGYTVLLECKPLKENLYPLGCFYSSVFLTNEKKPKIKFNAGI